MRDPTSHNPLLKLVLRGVRKSSYASPSRTRQPITFAIMAQLIQTLKHSRLPKHDKLMLTAAFTLAFYGLLRISEFSIPSKSKFDPRIHPTHTDIRWHKHRFTYHLKRSKTDQFQQGHKINFYQVDNHSCPYSAMKRYFSQARLYTNRRTKPLFMFHNGDPLTRRNCLKHLRELLKQANLSPHLFNTHSFRIGAATSAAASGISNRAIKHLGRWNSNAYRLYTRTHKPELKRAAKQLATAGYIHGT